MPIPSNEEPNKKYPHRPLTTGAEAIRGVEEMFKEQHEKLRAQEQERIERERRLQEELYELTAPVSFRRTSAETILKMHEAKRVKRELRERDKAAPHEGKMANKLALKPELEKIRELEEEVRRLQELVAFASDYIKDLDSLVEDVQGMDLGTKAKPERGETKVEQKEKEEGEEEQPPVESEGS